MTQVPALREALQGAAQRRYGRRRRLRYLVAVPVAGAIAAWFVIALPSSPEREVVATPTATPAAPHTIKSYPVPPRGGPTGPTAIVRATPINGADALFEREGGTENGRLLQAWRTPGMQGDDAHVFFFARGDQRCLSVPDPSTDLPGDRGVGCSPPRVFERFGVSLTIGASYAAVVPGTHRAPMYRRADGTRETLEPVEGLVALINAEDGSAVALYDGDGKRRTDAFRVEVPQTRHECSNGAIVDQPSSQDSRQDPCSFAGGFTPEARRGNPR